MNLSMLVGPETAAPSGCDRIDIAGLTADSRAVQPGWLFAALRGSKADGGRFIADAVANGAAAILADRGAQLPADYGVPVLVSAEPRRALALMAARFYRDQPATVVAVTGTSGKTSVADFTRQIFAALGHQAASLGTIGLITPGERRYGSLTSPDPVTLHRTLAELAAGGITHLTLEASSHGLDQHRVDGLRLRAAAFTNLGHDHLDYHPSVEAYLAAKLRLFSEVLPPDGVAVVNADSELAGEVTAVAHRAGRGVMTVGRAGETLALEGLEPEGFAQRLRVRHAGGVADVRLPLLGAYQAGNALLAAGLALGGGEAAGRVLPALERLEGVKGRLEVMGLVRGGLAVIDYAHKPDALAAALKALRPVASGRLVCVFGCGGDRDKAKRPIMGRIAAALADAVIVTDDNPRSESPREIRAAILAGAPSAREIGDRAEAIAAGARLLGAGDVLLVAGKGHETGQIVGDRVIPFSDHDVVRSLLTEPAASGAPSAVRPLASTPQNPASAGARGLTPASEPLWQWDELVDAAGARAEGVPAAAVTGFSIDTRTLQPGDAFVALEAERDGHDFVPAAFAAGAAAALVSGDYARMPGDGALLRAADPLAALAAIGTAARTRARARIVAVTGSAGKTGTKEMLRLCLADAGRTHASERSYNNHWGVPLTLARMPASAEYGVFEIGMNHAGEIAPLTRLVAPHVTVITTIEPVHLEYFPSVEAIAEAKAEIFGGLVPGGTAVLPHDNPHFALLKARAAAVGANVVSFGYAEGADVRCIQANMDARGSSVIAGIGSQRFPYRIGAPGEHYVKNSLAVLAALQALGADPMRCLPALVKAAAPAGRGARSVLEADGGRILLIDESYNANPASVRAALAAMATVPRADLPRRVAVLGDMLELGAAAPNLHRGLKEAVDAAGIDLVFACGPMMKLLFDDLKRAQQGAWAQGSAELQPTLLDALRVGDVVMIKGSLASRMGPLAEAVRARFSKAAG